MSSPSLTFSYSTNKTAFGPILFLISCAKEFQAKTISTYSNKTKAQESLQTKGVNFFGATFHVKLNVNLCTIYLMSKRFEAEHLSPNLALQFLN